MRRQSVVPSSSGLVPRTVEYALAVSRGARRGVVRAVAIVTMLGIYAVSSIGSIGTTALGVVGVSSLALVGTSTPANARWRRRGRYRRGYRRRGYWGNPWRYRRRRRRHRRFYFYF
jgi:hypothetical protein